MSDWTSGYVAELGYTFGYYTELNPLRLRLAFLKAGQVPPQVGTACELGFGQGMSTNLHAAASVVRWYGTDFNPSQASFAQELSRVSQSGAQLFDEAFDQFCARTDLPDFDFIGLHGIWSWISDENRAVIVDFLRRKLKVGGVLYISYNTQPGWAAMVPMRDLLTEHAEVMGADGSGIVSRIDGALAFVEQLLATNPIYARANPQVAERIAKIKEQNRHYLAHEYFNRDWEPMSFARMGQWLEPAKVQFACSANVIDGIDAVNLTADQQKLLASIPDPMFRQTVRDFCVNQQFRKDYWVKGSRSLNSVDQLDLLRAERVVMIMPKMDVSFMKVTGSLGEVKLNDSVYNPVTEALGCYEPMSLGQIEEQVKARGVVFAQMLEALIVLSSIGAITSAQDDATIAQARPITARLNRHLMRKSRASNDLGYLASPVTGGGITVPRFSQLFLLARAEVGFADGGQPADWARNAWEIISAQGQRLIKEGKTLESAEDNIAELTAQAQTFAEKQLPVLRALGIAA
jgi:SAM-dependent methyltransferase